MQVSDLCFRGGRKEPVQQVAREGVNLIGHRNSILSLNVTLNDDHILRLIACEVCLQDGIGAVGSRLHEMLTYFPVSIKGLGRLSLQLLPLVFPINT